MVIALWIYLFLTPLNFIGVLPGISLTRVVVFIPLFFLLLNFKKMKFRFDSLMVLPILYILVLFISISYSLNTSITIDRVLSIAQNITVVLLFSAVPFNSNEIKVIKSGIVYSGWFTLILLLFFSEPLGDTLRISIVINGVAQDPNDLIGYLMYTTVYNVSLFLKNKDLKSFLFILPFISVVLMTGSRGGLISVFIAIIFYILVYSSGSKRFLRNVFFSVSIVLVILFFARMLIPNDILERYTLESVFNDQGSGRFLIWESLWIIWKDSSLFRQVFGWGAGTVKLLAFKETVAHNIWLESLIEVGLLGMVSLVVFHIAYLNKAFRGKIYVVISAYIGLLVMTLSLSLYSYKPLWNILFLILLYTRYNQNVNQESGHFHQ